MYTSTHLTDHDGSTVVEARPVESSVILTIHEAASPHQTITLSGPPSHLLDLLDRMMLAAGRAAAEVIREREAAEGLS